MKRLLVLILAFSGLETFAAGYEPSLPFGAQTAGLAGVGSPEVSGSTSLFFNPAGLAGEKVGQDVSLNISPGWGIFKGPITDTNHQESSERKILYPLGLMYNKVMNDKMGFGVGIYIPGGSYANFPNMSVPGLVGTPTLKSDLTITEFAVGMGYKISDKLKVGFAWRVLMANADFTLISSPAPGTIAQTELRDLKDTQFKGIRLGAQYKLSDKTQIGFNFRNEVAFRTKGKEETTIYSGAAPASLGVNDVAVGSLFPTAINLGMVNKCADKWQCFGEYVWTQYSRVTNISVHEAGSDTPVELHWKDQHEIRLAGEYDGLKMPLRMGFLWSSQVTNKNYAAAAFTPPGSAQTLTVGTGKDISMGSQMLKLNGALEYGWSHGSDSSSGASYALNSYGFHLGAQYGF